MKILHCKICSKIITVGSKHGFCKSCWQLGKRNPSYKHGKYTKKRYCLDCGKLLCSIAEANDYKRCKSCNRKGSLHMRWKGGPPHCCFCGKQLKNRYAKYCFDCWYKYNTKENHYNWHNGASFLPYSAEFTKKLKTIIKERDNYTCQLCQDFIVKNTFKQFLTVHHIDYDKTNCNHYNLITLCNRCNSIVNYHRTEWNQFFIYNTISHSPCCF